MSFLKPITMEKIVIFFDYNHKNTNVDNDYNNEINNSHNDDYDKKDNHLQREVLSL